MEEVMCSAGHVHKNERSADDCDQRQAERAVAREQRQIGRIERIEAGAEGQFGSFYVNRRGKARMGR